MKQVNVKINGRDVLVDEKQDYNSLIKLAGKQPGSNVMYKSKVKCDHCGMITTGMLREENEELTVTEGMMFSIMRC